MGATGAGGGGGGGGGGGSAGTPRHMGSRRRRGHGSAWLWVGAGVALFAAAAAIDTLDGLHLRGEGVQQGGGDDAAERRARDAQHDAALRHSRIMRRKYGARAWGGQGRGEEGGEEEDDARRAQRRRRERKGKKRAEAAADDEGEEGGGGGALSPLAKAGAGEPSVDGSAASASHTGGEGDPSYRPPVLLLAAAQCLVVCLFLKRYWPEEDADAAAEAENKQCFGGSDRSNSSGGGGRPEAVTVGGSSFAGCDTAAAAAEGLSPSGVMRQRAGAGAGSAPRHGGQQQLQEGDESKDGADKPLFSRLVGSLRASSLGVVLFVVIAVVTLVTRPESMSPRRPTAQHVFFYAWITDLATGLGVLPFVCLRSVPKQYLGLANSVAAGMMSCASVQLFLEAIAADECPDAASLFLSSAFARCALGMFLGFVFIVATKRLMEGHDEIQFGDLSGMDAKKVLLIMVVMTLHSFTEGVGIGVAFGGERGSSVGFCIAVCLTIHNIPEGLAVALVLIPRGVSKVNASLWCILTSFPQPLMAVPAFLFVAAFLPLLPIGLGFASGAMLWVAYFELLLEAASDAKYHEIVVCSTGAFTGAYLLQHYFVG